MSLSKVGICLQNYSVFRYHRLTIPYLLEKKSVILDCAELDEEALVLF